MEKYLVPAISILEFRELLKSNKFLECDSSHEYEIIPDGTSLIKFIAATLQGAGVFPREDNVQVMKRAEENAQSWVIFIKSSMGVHAIPLPYFLVVLELDNPFILRFSTVHEWKPCYSLDGRAIAFIFKDGNGDPSFGIYDSDCLTIFAVDEDGDLDVHLMIPAGADLAH